jgi:NAD(P)-dependent dehydrogenase (short-subunit alcohol dehydrogenase family)
MDPDESAQFDALMTWLHKLSGPLYGVYAWSFGVREPAWHTPPQEAADETARTIEAFDSAAALPLIRLLQAAERADLRFRLSLVTRKAVAVDGDDEVAIGQAPLWGLGRTVTEEMPQFSCRRVDLGAVDTDGDALLRILCREDREDELAIRDGKVSVPRLVSVLEPPDIARAVRGTVAPAAGTLPVREDSTYIITGGLGGLGIKVAHELCHRGARHLLLVSRSARVKDNDALAHLRAAGVDVRVIAADVSRASEIARLTTEVAKAMPPVRGVVHAAGVLHDGFLRAMEPTQYRAVTLPKIAGAWNVCRAFATAELDFLLFFSSVSATLGAPGQGNYAAANAFLDAFATWLRHRGVPATSIAWGAWADVGMAADLGRIPTGMEPMAPALAVAGMHRAAGLPWAHIIVADIRWQRFLERYAEVPGLLTELRRTAASRPGAGDGHAWATRAQPGQNGVAGEHPQLVLDIDALRQAPRHVAHERLVVALQAMVASVLGQERAPGLHDRLFDIGIDSMMALELRNRVQRAVTQPMPSTLVFDSPTIAKLASFVMEHIVGVRDSTFEEASTSEEDVSELSRQDVSELLRQELAAVEELFEEES